MALQLWRCSAWCRRRAGAECVKLHTPNVPRAVPPVSRMAFDDGMEVLAQPLPTPAGDDIARLVIDALQNAGLLSHSHTPDLRVVTGEGERGPRRFRPATAGVATVVVVVAQPAMPSKAPSSEPGVEFRRCGDQWEITTRGNRFNVRHSVGMAQLMTLVRNPGSEIESTSLAGRDARPGVIDPLIDPSARAAYKAHVADLREEIEEAERSGDLGRVDQLRAELRFIAEHLAEATGLDGRDRRWTTEDERARVAVTKAVRRAIAAVGAADTGLGRALDAAVETGRVCVFNALFPVRVVD